MTAYTAVLGEKHPDTLTSMSNYAQALGKAGKGAEALGLQQRVLETHSFRGDSTPKRRDSSPSFVMTTISPGSSTVSRR